MRPIRTLILGAAGRDFHNFNVVYRMDRTHEVVGFTAQQIPHIADRHYPAALAGPHYPHGIPIHPEDDMEQLIHHGAVDLCVLSYSDLSHESVGHLASRANAAGADFALLGVRRTMLQATVPVVAVCASRTGAGKSQTSREIVRLLRTAGVRVAVLRHPMPYGDLERQRVQRFADTGDLELHRVSIEEREEYEPHIAMQSVVWAGVDYAAIVHEAEREAQVIVWDGGNNDTSFLTADLYITVVDPHRAGHELTYYPGETNVRLADVIIINKVDTADPADVQRVRANVAGLNDRAEVLEAESPIHVAEPDLLRGRNVLVIDDGPTLTHGGMPFGAGAIGATQCGGRLVDPRPYAVGEIAETLRRHPHLGAALPAMGYGEEQLRDLEATVIAAARDGVEAIAIGTPIDLARLIQLPIPHTRVSYTLQLRDEPALERHLEPVITGARRLLEVDPEC
jgi:predicted GTPase